MGSALMRGWSQGGENLLFHGISPHFDHHPIEDSRVSYFRGPEELPTHSYDLVVFAVKPHIIESILPCYKAINGLKTTVVAGKKLALYEEAFPGEPVVRMMPNTPVAIGEGVVLMRGSDNLSGDQKNFIENLFSPLGSVFWLGDESLFNAGTALSGSGPAYVFLMMEALAQGAQKLGFDERISQQLAISVVKGAALYAASSHEDPGALRRQVTSPAGTTAAALAVLSPSLEILMEKALHAAAHRGEELSQ